MDTSKKYIEMCKEAKELQAIKKYKNGNFFANFISGALLKERNQDGRPYFVPYMYTNGKCIPYDSGDYDIWLPRQDQLQEMVSNDIDILVEKVAYYKKRCSFDLDNCQDGIKLKPVTMEQLWLALVMKEKFNKKWNNKYFA